MTEKTRKTHTCNTRSIILTDEHNTDFLVIKTTGLCEKPGIPELCFVMGDYKGPIEVEAAKTLRASIKKLSTWLYETKPVFDTDATTTVTLDDEQFELTALPLDKINVDDEEAYFDSNNFCGFHLLVTSENYSPQDAHRFLKTYETLNKAAINVLRFHRFTRNLCVGGDLNEHTYEFLMTTNAVNTFKCPAEIVMAVPNDTNGSARVATVLQEMVDLLPQVTLKNAAGTITHKCALKTCDKTHRMHYQYVAERLGEFEHNQDLMPPVVQLFFLPDQGTLENDELALARIPTLEPLLQKPTLN